jgi:hypothetical protein
MGKTIMGAAGVSLDGFIADDHDDPGPLFDWFGKGDVAWSLPGSDGESRTTQASAPTGRRRTESTPTPHSDRPSLCRHTVTLTTKTRAVL